MSDETRSFTFEQHVPASPEAVYRALTNSSALREWFCDMATTVPREGGRCYLAWNDGYYSSGEFTRLVPGREVAYTWHGRGEPAPSTIAITLTPEEAGTAVRVIHGEIGSGDGWDEIGSALEQAWPYSLENLHSIFSSGEDLRFTQRPMLGITVGDFDAAVATKLGVPVTEGIRLDSVLPEMGAGAAGLQADDVVVDIGSQDVVDWASLTNALQGCRAGDDVDVTFYRGPEKRQVRMTLSGRPIPEIPEDLETLATVVRERYAQIDCELAEFCEGVSEAAAAHKPAPDSWSAREVLAHLIHSERGWHEQMANMVGGHEYWYDEWGDNAQVRVDATVTAFPTVEELLEELRRLNVETVAFVANLPPGFLARKSSYWRLAYQFLQDPFHHRAHMAQMREAIAAAG